MDPLLLSMTVLGAILGLLLLFVFIRNLEASVFWAVLLGPALGNSLGGFVINIFSGNSSEALASLRFLPAFLASIDLTFFDPQANQYLLIVGAVLIFLWFYVFLHFIAMKFGIWGLPILFPIIYVAGLGFPNLMQRLSTLPMIGVLASTMSGIPLLIFIEILMVAITILAYRLTRKKEMKVPFPKALTGEKEESKAWSSYG
jgi:hypothetical protein